MYRTFTRPINAFNTDGANPAAGLVLSGNVLCGTALNGGLQGVGTAFYLNPDASGFNLIRTFASPPDANNPQGEFAVSGNSFFGTSFAGGTNGTGTLFVGQTNGIVSVIRTFATVNMDTAINFGGANPCAALALSGSTLFGTASAGGASANGAAFSFTPTAHCSLFFTIFLCSIPFGGTNSDGAVPWGGLILSGNSLYGTASAGGAGGNGILFSINTDGGGFTVLHSFTAVDTVAATNFDGAVPLSGLVAAGDTLYGTTTAGGQNGRGTIFAIKTNGLGFAVLHHFSAVDSVTGTNADGAAPCAPLTSLGNFLYGTAPEGGAGGSGSIYSVKTDGTQFKTLDSFSAVNLSSGTNTDGAFPVAGLLLLGRSMYGTTFSGGPGAAGTVFSLPIPTTPATITNIVRNPNGSVTLYFLGDPNTTNVIQAAASLAPVIAWQNVSTNVADASGAWQFSDGPATNSTRFYRSYVQ